MAVTFIFTLKYEVFGRFSSIVANKLAKTNKQVRAPMNLLCIFRVYIIHCKVLATLHLNNMNVMIIYNSNRKTLANFPI